MYIEVFSSQKLGIFAVQQSIRLVEDQKDPLYSAAIGCSGPNLFID